MKKIIGLLIVVILCCVACDINKYNRDMRKILLLETLIADYSLNIAWRCDGQVIQHKEDGAWVSGVDCAQYGSTCTTDKSICGFGACCNW